MTGVNQKRVIVGGVVAGLVLNVGYAVGELLTAAELQRMLDRLTLPAPEGEAMLLVAMLGFAVGLATVWLYAGLLPRYGAGAATAVRAGGAVWLLACLGPKVSMFAFGMLTGGYFLVSSAIDLVVVLAAALAGSRLYREAELGTRSAGVAVAARG